MVQIAGPSLYTSLCLQDRMRKRLSLIYICFHILEVKTTLHVQPVTEQVSAVRYQDLSLSDEYSLQLTAEEVLEIAA